MARPTQVIIAIRLAAANYGLGILVLFLSWAYFSKFQTVASLIVNQLFSLSLFIWLYYKVYLGRNWARVTLLIVAILGGIMTLSQTFRTLAAAAPTIAQWQMVIGVGLNGIIVWLLFFSTGRYWFRRGSSGTPPHGPVDGSMG
jgi:amino acid transporter